MFPASLHLVVCDRVIRQVLDVGHSGAIGREVDPVEAQGSQQFQQLEGISVTGGVKYQELTGVFAACSLEPRYAVKNTLDGVRTVQEKVGYTGPQNLRTTRPFAARQRRRHLLQRDVFILPKGVVAKGVGALIIRNDQRRSLIAPRFHPLEGHVNRQRGVLSLHVADVSVRQGREDTVQLAILGGRGNEVQAATSSLDGALPQNAHRRLRLLYGEGGRVRLEDPGLLVSDLLQRIAQQGRVLQAQARHAHADRIPHDVGAVQLAAYPDLDDRHVDAHLQEHVEREDRQELKVCRHVLLVLPLTFQPPIDVPEGVGEVRLADRLAVYPDALSHGDEMRRAEEARAEAVPSQNSLCERACRSLAFGTGHVDDRQAVQLLQSDAGSMRKRAIYRDLKLQIVRSLKATTLESTWEKLCIYKISQIIERYKKLDSQEYF